jgi:hypothetical protein
MRVALARRDSKPIIVFNHLFVPRSLARIPPHGRAAGRAWRVIYISP